MKNSTSDNARIERKLGKVQLVGAGPGDPRLITLRAVECLRDADVVLYDYLANAAVLEHAPNSEHVCLGRHGRSTIWSQDDINRELVDRATSGKSVVWLKGGDPAIFARFADVTVYLEQHGVPYEVVPGITAALAAGSYAGIPLTHRDLASAVAFVTGQEHTEKNVDSVDFAPLASFPGTLVVYMGVTTAASWSTALMQHGKPPGTPVALVRRCSCPDQQIVRCRLNEVTDRLTPRRKFPPPVIAIIGQVAAGEQTMSWFTQRPLFGQCVLVTRPRHQAAGLRDALIELGAEVRLQSAIEISGPSSWQTVDSTLERITDFDWLVFSSANGVSFLLERMLANGLDLRRLASVKLATIGPGTTSQLKQYYLHADLQAVEFRAESLAATLESEAPGNRFLLARASRGREVLADTLRQAGAEVEQVVVYESRDVEQADTEIVADMAAGHVQWTTVTSSAIARSLVRLFGDQLRKTRLASISPVTSRTIRELGHEPAVEAQTYTMEGVVDAICRG